MDVPRRVDDPVPAAEQASRPHPVQNFGHPGPVVGVFVAQQQLGRGLHLPRLVAVHPRHLIGPHPPLIGDEELESAGFRRIATGQYRGDFPVLGRVVGIGIIGQCIRHTEPIFDLYEGYARPC